MTHVTSRTDSLPIWARLLRIAGSEPITAETAIRAPADDQTSDPPPHAAIGQARDVLWAFVTGRLRQQFFADARAFAGDEEATRMLGAGYVCLAGAIGWSGGVISTAFFNPSQIFAQIIGVVSAAAGIYGFNCIRRRRDPRPVMGVMVIGLLAAVMLAAFSNSGLLPPIVFSMPVAVGLMVVYMRGATRLIAMGFAAVVVAFCYLTTTGVIGLQPTYTEDNYWAMTFVVLSGSFICLGAVTSVANFSRDFAIEQARLANDTIMESANRSRLAMEAAKVGLWDVADSSLQKFTISDSFESITGYTTEEFNGLFGNVESFVHPDDIVSLRETFALGRKRMSRLRVDFRLKTKTRGYRWFSCRARYSVNPDGSHRVSGSLQDINFIKAAEDALRAGRDRAREANKAKSDFIALMSHEVRTPLNAILGSVEVLKRGDHDSQSRELITLIDDAGRGLLSMVNDLLDVSKIEAGKLDVTLQPTDIVMLVTRTVEFWRAQAESKGLQLSVTCQDVDGAAVLVDPVRVRQILGNLLSNAIKFTDAGEVSTRLAMHERADGRSEITLSVVDSGPGVPDAIAESIFAPFEQSGSSSGRGGTGLGLFISRRLARLMGGDVTLEPARTRGAHFRLTLVADSAHAAAANVLEAEDPAWAGRTILVVDDNDTNLRIASLLLSKFGLDVTTATSGAVALEICATDRFDAIMLDVVMPDMDGMETLRRLRSDPGGLNALTPTIALTAKLAAEDMARYAAAGFDSVAGKPINVMELAQSLAPFMVGQD